MSRITYSELTYAPIIKDVDPVYTDIYPTLLIGSEYVNKTNGNVFVVTNIYKDENNQWQVDYVNRKDL